MSQYMTMTMDEYMKLNGIIQDCSTLCRTIKDYKPKPYCIGLYRSIKDYTGV